MGFLHRLSTIRHGRGFGVHSPIAYRLIREVLPDKPAYYGDKEIDRIFADPRSRRIARILLRLIACFEPESVYIETPYDTVPELCGCNAARLSEPNGAQLALTDAVGKITIRCGTPDLDGPVTLDNEKDLRIVVYRKGLSECRINTTL